MIFKVIAPQPYGVVLPIVLGYERINDMADTKIEWCEKSWNPIAGCTKCSPGCENCYAERFAYRLACMEATEIDRVMQGEIRPDRLVKYLPIVDLTKKQWNGKVHCFQRELDIPLHWRKPSRIFVCSMSDLFHPKVPFEFIAKVWDIMFECHQHVFLILTKRIKRVAEFCKWLDKEKYRVVAHFNIHLGVSISNQAEADEKIPILLQIPAAVRWLSIEPMLGPINPRWIETSGGIEIDTFAGKSMQHIMKGYGLIDWVVVGGESGPKRRPCNTEWIQSIVDQCRAASVPVFVKQINVNGKVVKMPQEYPQEYPNRS